MTIAADNTASWLQQHANAPLLEPSPDWMNDLRAIALEQFEHVGLPKVRDEQWRYTNLRTIKSKHFNHPQPAAGDVQLPQAFAPRLVFVDGQFDSSASSFEASQSGFHFLPLHVACQTPGLSLEKAFGSTLPDQQHGFTLLNTAYCRGGYVLVLDANTEIEQPLEIVFISSGSDVAEQASICHTRNLVLAGANSGCQLIEHHVDLNGGTYLHNSVTEIIAQPGSRIDHYKLQNEASEAFHFGGTFIQQDRESRVSTHNLAIGSQVCRNDVQASLNGPGSHVEMNGLVLGEGRQHVDNHTQVDHVAANCSSDELYRSVLDDQARSVFRGRIVVAQDAQQTVADQQNNNLILSDRAEADSKPQLEILADDVKCSHGATVGQLDAKSLFYLRSRGIDEASARALLTFAFANEVLTRLRAKPLYEHVKHLLAGSLSEELEELL